MSNVYLDSLFFYLSLTCGSSQQTHSPRSDCWIVSHGFRLFMYLMSVFNMSHTHTHTQLYVQIYIELTLL